MRLQVPVTSPGKNKFRDASQTPSPMSISQADTLRSGLGPVRDSVPKLVQPSSWPGQSQFYSPSCPWTTRSAAPKL